VTGGSGHRAWPPALSWKDILIQLDPTAIRAAFFDMDGLLVDTEPIWFAAEVELIRELGGGELTPDHARNLVGKPIEASSAYLREVTGIDRTPEQLTEALNATMAKLVRPGVPWRPGASDLLGALRAAGVPCALVSASHRVIVDAVLSGLREDRFAFSVAHDDVPHTKPAPDPYLAAAARLGVEPADCVVFEDSPTGVASALAAGCQVIAVPGAVPIEPAPGITLVRSLVQVELGSA
jgi:HAD superfamily hydrolase (TIGR01509 family)